MKTAELDYVLPPERIAQTPVEPRDSSRLLVLDRATGRMEHRVFRDIGEYLRPGDLLVANESRVIPARLFGRKAGTGGRAEILLLRRLGETTWEALVRGRKMPPGSLLEFGDELRARVESISPSGTRTLVFDRPVEPLLDSLGVMPLPPYIHTPLSRPERYQTVYARTSGSAAAPTAGLHFTPELLERLRGQGVATAFVTLHIGLDTFKPIAESEIEKHAIHTEYCEVPAETAAAAVSARARGGRVIAVGTTAVRTLESAARPGPDGWTVGPYSGNTSLYIWPGYSYRVVDAMVTNFHLPRSTLLCLVSAFTGKHLMDRAYAEAIRQSYRFYSFGDAMLIM